MWGGSLWSGEARRPEWKPAHDLIWTNAAAARLLTELAPHLRTKAKQAAVLRCFLEHLWNCRRARDQGGRLLPLSREDLSIREEFYKRLKLLNRRGPVAAVPQTFESVERDEPRNLSPEYAAGFIDAEGSLMISKTRDRKYGGLQYRARASATNTDKAILKDMQRTYGGILTNQPARSTAWKHSYQLVWTDARVNQILVAVGPHLRLKRKQADLMRRFLRHKRCTPRVRDSQDRRFYVPVLEEVLAVRESFYRRMKALNAKGPPAGGDQDSHPDIGHAELAPAITPART